MKPELNVALVGYGFVGKIFHAPLIQATPGLRLHTVVSGDSGKVLADHAQVRVVAEAQAAFADPAIDLVVIAAPNAVHAPLALAALAQGKHVVVDKPFTLDLAQAREVIAAAARADRIVSVFQNRRWDADFLTLRSLLDAGTLGEVSECHSHFDRNRPQVADRWRENDQPGSGLWYDLGPHLLDQAVQLFGMPDALFADIGRQRQAAQADDYFNVLLRYPRLRVMLHGGSLVPAHGLRFAVHGSGGSYLKHGMDAQESALRLGRLPGEPGWGEDPRPGELHIAGRDGLAVGSVDGIAGNYLRYYQDMHAAITQGQPPPVTAQQALQVMALLDNARESAAQRREIDCVDP
ncbi:oxidoreductase [Pseudoxanthomonas gei]|uniref:Oxidoreductase n=1 Tax=Pseudoxanthomonas gei TaxID=1383030 RepID=A0ABX0AEC5_9GAMM|nr:oxidoreductase [Pseudoxanthomonas gei]